MVVNKKPVGEISFSLSASVLSFGTGKERTEGAREICGVAYIIGTIFAFCFFLRKKDLCGFQRDFSDLSKSEKKKTEEGSPH